MTAKKPGVVEVAAVTENGLTDRKIIAIAIPTKGLGKEFTVYNPLEGGWEFVEEDIKITANAGSLWDTGVAKNVIALSSKEDLTNVTATVKVTGATQKLWEEAGLIFYKDNDNYTAVQQKHAEVNLHLQHLHFQT